MIKDANNTNDMALKTIFKPIVEPLNLLTSKTSENYNTNEKEQNHQLKKIKYSESESSNCISEDFEEPANEEEEEDTEMGVNQVSNKTLTLSPSEDQDIHENSFKSLQSSPSIGNDSISWSMSSEVIKDVPYGVRNERGKLMLGKTRVFDRGHTWKIGSRIVKKTDGLKELLTKKIPNLDLVTGEDLQNYKLILEDTNAHRRNWNPSKPIISNKGFKYMRVIKPLFKFSRTASSVESLPRGEGIELLKKVKTDTDLVYWDNPNELVERLKLLLASWEAGNTGVINEVQAIIEELYEAGIINVEYKKHPSGKFSSLITVKKASRQQ
ncbi:hypothetical protein ABMA28_000546 [Loxostege sticticalis]|uniref:DUF8207 domain-containing protein n=1 Tax=Loxostege sticticalis TaxID=481309 RepID=A0ABD0TPH1_LOXSC